MINRLQDPDEKVRSFVLKMLCELPSDALEILGKEVILAVENRCLDRKTMVRQEAIIFLGILCKRYLTASK